MQVNIQLRHIASCKYLIRFVNIDRIDYFCFTKIDIMIFINLIYDVRDGLSKARSPQVVV